MFELSDGCDQVTPDSCKDGAAPGAYRSLPWIIECGKPGVNPFHIFETVDCDEGVDLIAFAADTSPEPLMIATDAKAVEVSVRRRGISGGELRRTQNGKSAAEVRLAPPARGKGRPRTGNARGP